jgi:hypothetical protein
VNDGGLACTGGRDCGVNIDHIDKVVSCDYLTGDFGWCGMKQSSGRKVEEHSGEWMNR